MKHKAQTVMYGLMFVIGVAVLVLLANQVGLVKLGVTPQPAPSTPTSQVATTTGGPVCGRNTDTTNIQYKLQDEMMSSDGTYTQVQGTIDSYRDSESASYDTQTNVAATGFTSTTIDPACGSQVTAIVSNSTSGFYNASFGPWVVDNLDYPKVLSVKLIATPALTIAEVPGATYNATNAFNITMAAGGTYDLSVRTVANTAHGQIRKPIMCLMHNDTGLDNTATILVGGTKVATPGHVVGANYINCYTIPGTEAGIKDFGDAYAKWHLAAKSGTAVGSVSTMFEFKIVDFGGYVLNGKYYDGYTSFDGATDTGVNDVNLYIQVS